MSKHNITIYFMENWIQILSFAFNSLILLIGLYIIFLKDYFSQKGKNLATKEDISEITIKVEDVKSQINEISLKKQDNFMEFKKSILEYNNELIHWIEFSIKDISLVSNDPWDKEGLKEKLYSLQNQFASVQKAYWRLFIYTNRIDDEWFEKIWKELNNVIPLHKLTISFFDEISRISTRLNLGKEDNEITKKTLQEFKSKKDSFVIERDRIEGNANKALTNTARLIRDKLQIKYDFNENKK